MKKNYAFGRLCKILEPSPERIEPLCPYMGQCGGCLYGALSYEGQLALKEKQVRDKLIRLGGLTDPVVRPIIGMEEPFRYRNKATMPVWTGGVITRKGGVVENLGEPAVGFYRAKSHEVIDCCDCLLQSEPAMAAAEALRQFMISDNITAYDPKWEKGLMRHPGGKDCQRYRRGYGGAGHQRQRHTQRSEAGGNAGRLYLRPASCGERSGIQPGKRRHQHQQRKERQPAGQYLRRGVRDG